MNERTFLIAVDAWNTSHDISTVKDYITSTPKISNWWNYIPYVFIVRTELSPDELSRDLRQFTKDASLLVIEVRHEVSQGLLPKPAWDWLDKLPRQPRTSLAKVGVHRDH